MRRNTILLAAALVLLALPAAAQVDFTRYVAIGDSLSAGFQSGGLVGSLSRNSYPALVNRQATGGDANFLQPLISEPGIPAVFQLNSLAGPVIAPKPGTGTLTNPLLTRPYNNLAVPGARVRDTVATVTGNLHDVVLQSFSPALRGKTALQQAVSLNPTFTTIWIGNNDVLAAATTGIAIEGVTLTPVARFEADLRAIASAVAATNSRMAFANIPEVTAIPFVTTVSRFVVNPATNQPVLVNGNPVPLIGPRGPLGAGDRVLLTASTELRAGKGIPLGIPGGTGQPLSDGVVLDANEIAAISAKVAAYNTIIATVATERSAALIDINAVFRQAATAGIPIGGVTFTPAFLTGGIFSYDGVHPTSFGYAFLANEFIKGINARFGVSIPQVDLFGFMFGGTATSALSANSEFETPAFVFTEEAKKNLFWALGVQETTSPRPRGGRRGGRR